MPLSHNEQHLMLKRLRRELLAEVKRLLCPHMWDSGYSKCLEKGKGIFGAKRPLRIWVPRGNDGKPSGQYLRIKTIALSEIEGFTEDGVITDSHAGGLVTTYWHGVTTDDLLAIRIWATKQFAKVSA